MHKKFIRGVTYYYTNVREGGRVKTIYLGRTVEEAKKREVELKGIMPGELKESPRFPTKALLYVLIIAIATVTLFIGGNLVGYLISVQGPAEVRSGIEVGVTFENGSFLPQDALIEVSVGNQASNLTLDELLAKTGIGVVWDTGDFYYGGVRLSGSGVGYGFENRTTFYLNTSDLGISPLQVPGTYTVVTRIIYNSSVLEETSSTVDLTTPAAKCEDRDGDGYDTCEPDTDCNDQNPDIHPGAKEICGNLIDEDCSGYDEPCFVKLSDTIKSKNITYIKDEVVSQMEKKQQARVIIKLKDTSAKAQIEKTVAPEREIKGLISAVVTEPELIDLVINLTADDIELIQIDHPIKLVLDEVVNQTGVSQVWNSNITGKGQTVCVVDSGIDYNHPNLSSSYLGGYDFINNDNDPMDDYGHGTYVSGIIAGIAKDSKILAAKVFGNDGLGYESDILAGIDYCIQNKDTYNVSVMLMSFGGGIYNTSCYCDSNLVANESNYAVSKGILAVAASGNDGRPFLKAPACGSNVTSVGAVDKSDNIANFTNIEPLLDLLAPGVEVSSAKLGGGFETKNGTSISAAVVAGIAPLILENESLNPYELQFRLRSTGLLIAYNGTNYPRVDAYAALTNKITNNPYVQQGTQCEGQWEEYEPLAFTCDTCTGQCGYNCVLSGCYDGCGSQTSCGDCLDLGCCSGYSCVQGSCGAECQTGTNCQLQCNSGTARHTSCDTGCNSCQCTGSQECTTVCSGSSRYTACSAGTGCTTLQACTSVCSGSSRYTACSTGTGCTTLQACTLVCSGSSRYTACSTGTGCTTLQACTSVCSGNSRYTSCSTGTGCTGLQDCTKQCPNSCARYSGCSGGCTGSTDCGSYTCSAGTGCTSTCSIACGAQCESNDDCGLGTGVCNTGTCDCDRVTDCTSYNCFYIKDSSGNNVAIIDALGDMDIKGSASLNQASCTPPANSWILQDSSGTVVAHIDPSGNICLKGKFYQNQAGPCSPPANSFIVQDSSGNCRAYINSTGNVWLDGVANGNAVI